MIRVIIWTRWASWRANLSSPTATTIRTPSSSPSNLNLVVVVAVSQSNKQSRFVLLLLVLAVRFCWQPRRLCSVAFEFLLVVCSLPCFGHSNSSPDLQVEMSTTRIDVVGCRTAVSSSLSLPSQNRRASVRGFALN